MIMTVVTVAIYCKLFGRRIGGCMGLIEEGRVGTMMTRTCSYPLDCSV